MRKENFLSFKGHVAAVAVVVGAVAKSSEKALVKRFCEKNFTEFLARLEKMVGVFLSSPAIQNRILNLKTQNFAVKSNSENHFTLVQKNSECAAQKQKKNDENGKNLSFAACKLVVLLYIKQ